MKFRIIFLLSFLFLLASCTEVEMESYTYEIPIYSYSTEAEAEAGLIQEAPHKLSNFGNIYVYKQYLLINEAGVGIHIYDNTDPANPQQLSFMNIPGNMDMAILNDVLYVDSYDDLLSLDISQIQNIRLINRLDSVFPAHHPSFGRIIGFKDTTVYYEVRKDWFFRGVQDEDDLVLFSASGGDAVGTAGSMARFTLLNNHLYCVDRNSLYTVDITAGNLSVLQTERIPFFTVVETIFPYGDHLFIGSTNGVFIYDVSNPQQADFVSQFIHARACDPVYVSDSLAFVTLRSNNENRCFGVNNQMDILNMQNIDQPELLQSFPMASPYGLGIKDSLIFVCEGSNGLKVFKYDKVVLDNRIKDVTIRPINEQQNLLVKDVIPLDSTIIVVGDDILNQYYFNGNGDLRLLSTIR